MTARATVLYCVSQTPSDPPPIDKATLVSLPGDLVNCDVEVLRQALLSALVRPQAIDLHGAEVTRAGTASLQLLLSFLREAKQKQIEARLLEPSAPLLDALRCLGLADQPEISQLLPGAA